jgi:hypothetical protein
MSITYAQFLDMQARTKKNSPLIRPDGEPAPLGKEADLHYGIIDFCKSKNWIYFHGSMARATARTRGEPDFVILANSGRVFFIEAKTRIGKLSLEQQGIAMWAEKLGHKIHVVRSMEEFRLVVE